MVELKRSLRFACVLAVTAMAVGCGPATEEEAVDGAPAQDEVLATDAPPPDVSTVEQGLTVYRWVNTGYWCKQPINVAYECQRRGYDGGTSSQCGKTGTLLIYCYVRT
jgi:hypothetical protein